MKLLYLICLIIFLLIGKINAQKVYSVKYDYQADVKVFVTDHSYQADLLVYKVKYEYQAKENEGLWYFTSYEYQASKKIYLTKVGGFFNFLP